MYDVFRASDHYSCYLDPTDRASDTSTSQRNRKKSKPRQRSMFLGFDLNQQPMATQQRNYGQRQYGQRQPPPQAHTASMYAEYTSAELSTHAESLSPQYNSRYYQFGEIQHDRDSNY